MENILVTVGYMAFLFGLMYLLIIRPQKKKTKQAEEMKSSLRTGDTVITIGGIVGKVVSVKPDEFTLEVKGSKVKMTFKKWALSAIEKASNDTEEVVDPAEVE